MLIEYGVEVVIVGAKAVIDLRGQPDVGVVCPLGAGEGEGG